MLLTLLLVLNTLLEQRQVSILVMSRRLERFRGWKASGRITIVR
jgi:hypothetical protein